MGDVVNLNRFRKAKEKAVREAQATANRTRYGRTKDQRTLLDPGPANRVTR